MYWSDKQRMTVSLKIVFMSYKDLCDGDCERGARKKERKEGKKKSMSSTIFWVTMSCVGAKEIEMFVVGQWREGRTGERKGRARKEEAR